MQESGRWFNEKERTEKKREEKKNMLNLPRPQQFA